MRSKNMTLETESMTAYDFSFEKLDGTPLPLAEFRGKALLVVNTASRCGFTPQYQALENLWKARQDAGLVVLGVPCDDFGGQEPGSASEIAEFCSLNFGVTFPLTSKTEVKGPRAHPFYRWANQQAGVLGQPHWNFHKYLFDRRGGFATWFSTITSPDSGKFSRAIDAALAVAAT